MENNIQQIRSAVDFRKIKPYNWVSICGWRLHYIGYQNDRRSCGYDSTEERPVLLGLNQRGEPMQWGVIGTGTDFHLRGQRLKVGLDALFQPSFLGERGRLILELTGANAA